MATMMITTVLDLKWRTGMRLAKTCWVFIAVGSGMIAIMLHTHSGRDEDKNPGPGCSKLTTSLVNVSLKFQT